MRLRWVDVCFRRSKEGSVERFLNGPVEELQGSSDLRMRVAHLLSHFNHAKHALRLAYDVFFHNADKLQVHLQYGGLLLLPTRSRDMNLDVTVIGNDTAFEIEDDRGEHQWFIVEPNPTLRTDAQYISPESPIAKKAVGLKPDELIVWGQGGGRRDWKIVTIKHK